MHHVFVYGTLKRGRPNAHIGLPRAEFLGHYRTCERYPLVIAGPWYVPNLLGEPGDGFQVSGELYALADDILAELDDLESVHLPTGYRRVQIAIEPVDAPAPHPRTAWTYLRDRRHAGIVHDGPMAAYPLDDRYVPVAGRTP
jgi:gamma-glutamylaminecyclotransferase